MSLQLTPTVRPLEEVLLRDRVIALARESHFAHWRMTGHEGTGDRLDSLLTEPWQAYVQAVEANSFASSNPQQLAECHYE
ncbi:MAG TPA: hypothetical protein VIR01_15080 [Pyrinomonadaceae bacterium]|jgi:hypothetical protein